jgi:hypothetical protein
MIVSSGATHSPETTALAWDGDPNTRWTSGAPMEPTMAFWVVLDKPYLISCVVANAGVDTDAPASWAIAVMDDEGGHGRKEVASGAGVISAVFEPVRGQVVRLECISTDQSFWWSIHELTITATEIVIEEPPLPDEEVGPAVFNEVLARYWSERWAVKFSWKISEPCFVTGPGELLVTQSITYPILRNKGDGVFEPWPFE